MLRAVPLTLRMAASRSKQLRSGILIFAISSTCFSVILPTLFLFGSADPFARFTARLIRTGTGGVLVMNVNERSLIDGDHHRNDQTLPDPWRTSWR